MSSDEYLKELVKEFKNPTYESGFFPCFFFILPDKIDEEK